MRPKFASSVPTCASASRSAFLRLKMRLVCPSPVAAAQSVVPSSAVRCGASTPTCRRRRGCSGAATAPRPRRAARTRPARPPTSTSARCFASSWRGAQGPRPFRAAAFPVGSNGTRLKADAREREAARGPGSTRRTAGRARASRRASPSCRRSWRCRRRRRAARTGARAPTLAARGARDDPLLDVAAHVVQLVARGGR